MPSIDLVTDLITMENLKNTDFTAYTEAIAQPWPEQLADIALLKRLISEDGAQLAEHIKLAVYFETQTDGVDIKLPAWLLAAYKAFEHKYGPNYGGVFLEKTLAQIWSEFEPQRPIVMNTGK